MQEKKELNWGNVAKERDRNSNNNRKNYAQM